MANAWTDADRHRALARKHDLAKIDSNFRA